jgi:hypothetical protein
VYRSGVILGIHAPQDGDVHLLSYIKFKKHYIAVLNDIIFSLFFKEGESFFYNLEVCLIFSPLDSLLNGRSVGLLKQPYVYWSGLRFLVLHYADLIELRPHGRFYLVGDIYKHGV